VQAKRWNTEKPSLITLFLDHVSFEPSPTCHGFEDEEHNCTGARGRIESRPISIRSLPLLLALLSLSIFQPRTWAYQPQYASGQVILTEKAFRHIMERHWPDSTAPGAGKFQNGITEEGLRALINQTVQNGHSRVNTNGRPGVIYEYDFQRQIGTNIDGQPATRLRVVVNKRNQVVTAFPF
jgi:hypothetical protein